MKKISYLDWASILLAIATSATAERKNWALLVAGSAGYTNYRHQADVCHAYQVLHQNGIPDEQIVVMMYDNIAYNPYNPYPGNIINKPDGPNVYPGVPKDYTGRHVNADVFLAVLQGDKNRVRSLTGKTGKVIESGPDDHVFVFYSDHGGEGVVSMPFLPSLKAKPLNDALIKMYTEKKFAKLVFYLEACDSGSMFANYLPNNISVFATTASKTDESSYGYYCENDRHTCLGDLYSVRWMEDSESEDLHTETLEQQYEIVKKRTNLSHVMVYGDQSFSSLPVEQFLGNQKSLKYVQKFRPTAAADQRVIPTDMVGIYTLESLLMSEHPIHVARRTEFRRDVHAQYWIKAQTSEIFTNIAKKIYSGIQVSRILNTRADIKEWDCYDRTMDRLFELCPRIAPQINDFVLRKMNVLVNLCNEQVETKVISAIDEVIVSSPLCF